MPDKIDITGLDKAAVLAALYNEARTQGMGFMEYTPENMSCAQAQTIINERVEEYGEKRGMYFDYLKGRVMKVDLSGDSFSPFLYDRDNGEGKAARIIERLRNSKSLAA